MLTTTGFAQSNITGKVVDRSDKTPLTNATVVLLNPDSILKYHTRVQENGSFQIKDVQNSDYIFIVSYPKFETHSHTLSVKENTNVGDIYLSSQANLIEEVVVEARIPIRIKGDTLEYDAASFETEKNAKLEDLFRRLPGLTVSADGEITAQGKSVSKVLIDGEEFFGYDPKIAIRNIRADAVDKVQVYERKSEEAELTGIDDGQRIQTLNVVLKEEARSGIFGNIEANAGSSDLYTANLFAAKFNRSERFGVTANTNNMGARAGGREGSLRMNSQISGHPKNTSIGANYENLVLNKKLNINANYNFDDQSNRNTTQRYNKEIVSAEEIQETNSSSNNKSSDQNHTLNSRIRWTIDSTSNLNFQLNTKKGQTASSSNSESYMTKDGLDSIRDYSSENENFGDDISSNIRLNYRKRLNKNGRSINIYFNHGYNDSHQQSDVYQRTYFHKNDSTHIVDQDRYTDNTSHVISTQVQFNDRITERLNYTLGYSVNLNNNKNRINAYNNESGNRSLDDLYSQNLNNQTNNQSIIANLNYNLQNFNLSLSNRTNYRKQSLDDSYRDIELERSYWDNDLNINGVFRISNRKSINANYQNSFDIPSFSQLQPFQPQTSPIFKQLGNPDLKRAVNHNFNINYNTISMLKGTSWNLNSNLSLKNNPIVNKRTVTDTLTTSTFVNVMGKTSWNANFNANYGQSVFNKKVQLNIFSGLNYNNGFTYTRYDQVGSGNTDNQYELNNTQNARTFIGLGFNEQDSKGLDYDFSWRFNINNQRNSLQSDLNYTNLSTGGSAYLKYFLPFKSNITANVNYNIEGPTKFYKESIQQFYTNIEFSKKLLKSESLVASLKVFDVFNSYNTTNRNYSDNQYSESTREMLTRYILFGLKWDFNKNLGKKNND